MWVRPERIIERLFLIANPNREECAICINLSWIPSETLGCRFSAYFFWQSEHIMPKKWNLWVSQKTRPTLYKKVEMFDAIDAWQRIWNEGDIMHILFVGHFIPPAGLGPHNLLLGSRPDCPWPTSANVWTAYSHKVIAITQDPKEYID